MDLYVVYAAGTPIQSRAEDLAERSKAGLDDGSSRAPPASRGPVVPK